MVERHDEWLGELMVWSWGAFFAGAFAGTGSIILLLGGWFLAEMRGIKREAIDQAVRTAQREGVTAKTIRKDVSGWQNDEGAGR